MHELNTIGLLGFLECTVTEVHCGALYCVLRPYHQLVVLYLLGVCVYICYMRYHTVEITKRFFDII